MPMFVIGGVGVSKENINSQKAHGVYHPTHDWV